MLAVISSVKTCNYKLSKYLVRILTPLLGKISNSHIKNNLDFIEKLNKCKFEKDFKLYSFDVKSLFTNIPVNSLFEFLLIELKKYVSTLPLLPDQIIELIKLCVVDNLFVFEGEIYKQISGLGMGNPLSPLLANLYMEFYEKHILTRLDLPHGYVWFRYVDDIFICWPDDCNIQEFLQTLNNLVPTIKFTLECEINNKLPFLDILVHRCDRSFKYSIYRKPTNINSFIHNYSNHENNIKKSVFKSMFLRALNIVSPEFMDEEIKNIYNIGFKHKYNKYFLDNCFSKSKQTFYNKNSKTKQNYNKILVLPYNESFKEIPRLCSKLNISVVFNYRNKIKDLLIKNAPLDNQGVIYKINCISCDKFYVGSTGRILNDRIKEHSKAIQYKQQNSAIFNHYLDTGHRFNFNNVEILKKCPFYKKRNIIESFYIDNTWERNVNNHTGPIKLDNISKRLLYNIYKID